MAAAAPSGLSPLLRTIRRVGRCPAQPLAVPGRDVQRFRRRGRQLLPRPPDHKAELVEKIGLTPFSREEFGLACELDPSAGQVERARRFYVRARQVRTGLAQTASLGRWANCKNTSRAGMSGVISRWLGGVEALPEIAERLLRVQIENRPALDVIRLYDDPGSLFYCDPPYVHDTRGDAKAYGHEMTDHQHVELAAALNAAVGLVAISNYDCELMRRLYPVPKWRIQISPERTIHSTKDKRAEVLWTNFDLGTGASKPKGALFDDAD